MFGWGVLKCRVPDSVQFCTVDLPVYIFLKLTHPYVEGTHLYPWMKCKGGGGGHIHCPTV